MELQSKPEAPGWYAIGFKRDDGTMQYDEICEYHGDGLWTDDSGEEKESLYDPVLQDYVAMDAADSYVRQG